jgi:3-hydroxybutyryl-CoA dehydrogenase
MGVRRMVVVGGGTMGLGIAYTATNAGYTVQVVEVDADRRENAVARIGQLWDAAVERGKLTADQVTDAWTRFTVVPSLEQVETGADLIVEAVPERRDLKRDVLTAAEAREPVLLATNTSSIAIAELARDLRAPDRFVGLHFFNPVPLMKLVEVVRSPLTTPEAFEEAVAFAATLGKTPVRATDKTGFVVNRLLVPYLLDAIRALEEGVGSAVDIDQGMQLGCGHPMGPLTLLDFVGLDTTYYIANIMFDEFREKRFAPPPLLKRMVQAGLHGKKTGRGFYDYSQDPPRPTPGLV